MVRVCSVVRCARAVRMLHNIEVRGMRMLHNMEVHAPSWPSTACDFGGPRSVAAVCPVLTDATAARPANTIWLRPQAALGGLQWPITSHGAIG